MNGILSECSTFWQVIAGIVFFAPVITGWIFLGLMDIFVSAGGNPISAAVSSSNQPMIQPTQTP
ncbi:hypothetical protein A3H26_03555 [candidate division WWE3 bacterium RIFCSPLOWO2_12_FULL_36_10]|uniref:Uncharacterized protein n=1 Tax=candidate division WWE3 bacterium RIFCSPLOWO2_12_FULL_36_10 TaxID=1802630 RepID=A0A1F4VGC5_UNCKA|nr:MAG: hypothetical protein A3H26_03555 [candidate division WWE3 bacterium RIFCSPLOWO2_12_FULL_36_10]